MDRALFEYKIKSSGRTTRDIQEHLGLSYSGFYKKMNEITQFTREEIQKIMKYLNLNGEDVINIFFKQKMS